MLERSGVEDKLRTVLVEERRDQRVIAYAARASARSDLRNRRIVISEKIAKSGCSAMSRRMIRPAPDAASLAHHLRADESAGPGNENSPACNARNQGRSPHCRRAPQNCRPGDDAATLDAIGNSTGTLRNYNLPINLNHARHPSSRHGTARAVAHGARSRRWSSPRSTSRKSSGSIQLLNALVDFDAERVRAQAAQSWPRTAVGIADDRQVFDCSRGLSLRNWQHAQSRINSREKRRCRRPPARARAPCCSGRQIVPSS